MRSFCAKRGPISHELPYRLRAFLHDFRLLEPDAGVCLLSGFDIDTQAIGETPTHWRGKRSDGPGSNEEMLLVLLASLLGEPIAWATQQDGFVVHDVIPVKGHETSQIGTGSEETLLWHTEDAFHPCRGDYIGLLCLRNPDATATTFAPVASVELEETAYRSLFDPVFTIRPDYSHRPQNNSQTRVGDTSIGVSFDRIEEMRRNPPSIPVLSGAPAAPYVCVDPVFMDPVEDSDAKNAVESLIRQLDENLSNVVLEPGDVIFIDNFRAVHGRKAFKARHDGRDRWLKRINIARDLRKSRAYRASSASRIIQ